MCPSKKICPLLLLSLAISASCLIISPSTGFAAGPQSASVSATVLPTPENTKPKRPKNFLEKMDPIEQLTVGSGVGLGMLVVGGGLFFTLRHRKRKSA